MGDELVAVGRVVPASSASAATSMSAAMFLALSTAATFERGPAPATGPMSVPLVPLGVFVIKGDVAVLAEPQRFFERDLHDFAPRVAGCLVGKMKEHVYFFERAVCSFGIVKIDQWNNDEVRRSEDDVCSPTNVVEGYWSNKYNSVGMLVT